MRSFHTIFIVFLISSIVYSRPITVEDTLAQKNIESVRLNPDGSSVLALIKSSDLESNIYRNEIFLIPSDTNREIRKLASGIAPQWSPDGKSFSFIKTVEGYFQIFLSSPELLNNDTLSPISTADKGIVKYNWSPDGRFIAYTANSGSSEDFVSGKHHPNLSFADSITQYQNIFLVDLSNNNSNYQISFLPETVTAFDWSPDSAEIAFSAQPSSRDQDSFRQRLSILNLSNSSVRKLLPDPGSQTAPRWSPDGKTIAFLTCDKNDWLGQNRIKLIDPDGSNLRPAIRDKTENVYGLFDWSSDSQYFYFPQEDGVNYRLGRINLSNGSVSILTQGTALLENFSQDTSNSRYAYSFESQDAPPEVILADNTFTNRIRTTEFNSNLSEIELGRTELIQYSSGPFRPEGILVKPAGFDPSKKYPLLVILHGGPTSCFSARFLNGRWAYPAQVFADLGYVVFMPNVRGSSGYSESFRKANQYDWGGGDYRDVMAGVSGLVRRGIADPKRMGVMGWSYGGYLTAWIISQTNIFKAASVGAGITDLYSLYGTIDIPQWMEDFFGGSPYGESKKSARLYRERSPITYARKIKTPTLIQHGEKDPRVPVGQAYELYRALKKRKVHVELVLYPKQGHVPSEPELRLESMKQNIRFFDKYLK